MNNYDVYDKAKRIGRGFKTSDQVSTSFRYVNLALDYLIVNDDFLYRQLLSDIPSHLWGNFFDHFKPFEPRRMAKDINFLTIH